MLMVLTTKTSCHIAIQKLHKSVTFQPLSLLLFGNVCLSLL
ncbi:unnamed protein product [Taenia asiatica]|uniref:Uncharacterized protein n=1 Tax=Taenia asiatica TaxID=60517 RepID=A0A0R3WFC0_TAEAS|nr:unnamed protein product [Taenia asiatica]